MNIDTKDRSLGLYSKFDVKRADGRDAPGEKHDGCAYYVLDLTHDPHAIPALRAYADSCEDDFPALARDLRAIAHQHEHGGDATREAQATMLANDILLSGPVPEDTESSEVERLRAKVAAMTAWLEQHHPEVFREGLWDALNLQDRHENG